MPKVIIDSTLALTASCPPGRQKIDYYDQACIGLVMEVRPSGGTFAYRYRDDHGRQRQVKIANVGDISPSEARKQAQRLKSQAITGRNPAQERKDKRQIPTWPNSRSATWTTPGPTSDRTI